MLAQITPQRQQMNMQKSSYGMLGKHHNEASKRKISEALRGRFVRKALSKEEIARRTETRRKNGWNKNPEETRRKQSENNARANLGRKQTYQERLKKSSALLGEKNHNWKGGITPINDRIRKSAQYKIWRSEVFKRDDYTCQICEKRGGKLHIDHIKPFALFPELRFLLSNGRVLCIPCHYKTNTYGWRKIYHI